MMQFPAFENMISAFQKMPNVTVTLETNATVTYKITWLNWLKYQGDWSGDRVRKFRAKNDAVKRPKKRREEKRKEDTPTVPKGTEFDLFWGAYPRKTGKGAARAAWDKKVSNGDAEKIMAALAWQVSSDDWTRDEGQYIPHPATYLNQCRWEDEPLAVVGGKIDLADKNKFFSNTKVVL